MHPFRARSPSPPHQSSAYPLLYSELTIAAILLRSRDGLEWFTLKNRSLPAQLLAGLLLAAAALTLTACNLNVIYREPAQNYAGRPIPPSGLLERVMAAYTVNGSQGGLEILDGLRDIRSNVQNTIPSFSIKGFSAAYPTSILNFPEQTTGYVLSYTTGTLSIVNYSTEASTGSAGSFGDDSPSVTAAPGGTIFAGAEEGAGALILESSQYGSVTLNLPDVDKVVVNQGGTVVLAMVRNSNALYRVVKLPATPNPTFPPGYVDCEPLLLPVFCVVPVGNTNSAGVAGAAYDQPNNAVFSLDGNYVYVLNCGPECSGKTAGVAILQEGPLVMTNVPTVNPLSAPAPLAPLPVANPIPVPGGATAALSDGTNLYVSGQQLQSNGLFAGNLSLINLTSYTVGPTYSISDGTHTKMLFADNNTLWIGSQQCANGQRAYNAANHVATQAANYNCLTRFTTGGNAPLLSWVANQVYSPGNTVSDGVNVQVVLTGGTSGKAAPSWNTTLDQATTDNGVVWVNVGAVSPVQIIPIVTPNNPTNTTISASNPINTNIQVLYPNTNLNSVYYGDLSGVCWVQNFLKVYTAYGGQIHAFNTTDGSEISNFLITVPGTVLDVAYMDAESNSAD